VKSGAAALSHAIRRDDYEKLCDLLLPKLPCRYAAWLCPVLSEADLRLLVVRA